MSKPTKVPALGPSTPVAVAGPLLCEARIADVRRLERAFAGDAEPDADAVHDMRVAARRLRVALALFGDELLRALEPQVKALQDALGGLRDIQVHRGWVSSRQGEVPAAADLARRMDGERPDAEKKVRAAVHAWAASTAPVLERAAPMIGGRGKLGGRRIAREVERSVARLERRLWDVQGDLDAPTAHALRIAAKRVRYLAELIAPTHKKRAGRLLEELEPLVDRLGDLHDLDVRTARLEKLGADVAIGDHERDAARTLLSEVQAQRAEKAGEVLGDVERWRVEDFLGAVRQAFGPSRSGGLLRMLSEQRAQLQEGATAAPT